MVVTAGNREGRLQAEGLHEHKHQILARPQGIGMALEVLLEADGGVFLRSGLAESTLVRRKRVLP
ncbi:MAG: hypothetical protein RLZZ609_3142 [Cyanobacteriota bacterium]|jgi:hypothetical protein